MQILFDSVDINAYPYTVIDIPHESVAQRDVFEYELARARGSVIVTSEYRSKEVQIAGMVRGSSRADLETNMDAIKELLNRSGKNLDIDYGSGTRRYKNCYARLMPIQRSRSDITRGFWNTTIIVPDGVGYDTSATNVNASGITAATYNGSLTAAGNTRLKPKFTITFSAVTGTLNSISLQNGNYKIELQENIVSGDVVVIDTDVKIITLNGVSKDFIGQFPLFYPGSNSYTIVTNGTTRTYAVGIEYYPAWL